MNRQMDCRQTTTDAFVVWVHGNRDEVHEHSIEMATDRENDGEVDSVAGRADDERANCAGERDPYRIAEHDAVVWIDLVLLRYELQQLRQQQSYHLWRMFQVLPFQTYRIDFSVQGLSALRKPG